MKVMTIVGTRPEIIKLSRVIAELDRHMEHTLVHTGQNFDYELNDIFFKELNIRKPDVFLGAAGENAATAIGNIISRADEVMARMDPDAVLVLGDTNSCLSVIAAKRRKIPVFHMEAGNRCFDERVPEEINRRIIDHISDINMPYTEHARRYLLAEGLRPEMVIKTGSPMKEVLDFYAPRIEGSDVLDRLGLTLGRYFVVSAHREENVDDERSLNDIADALNLIAKTYGNPVVVTVHPRTEKMLASIGQKDLHRLVVLSKPFGFPDYVKLQKNAACVISDSGTITEESAIVGFPAITIRQAHERPEGMDHGVLIMCGLVPDQVLEAMKIVMSQQGARTHHSIPVDDYDVAQVSQKVTRIIASYVDYVNRNVWHKVTRGPN
jgi:UDP-N-acetylglucosamine 2-epimerase (non-hydrolysing)